MIVLDASAVLEILLGSSAGASVRDWMAQPGQSLHAPHLLDVETAQVIRRYVAAGEITAHQGEDALADLGDLPIHRYAHHPFLGRIWALRDNLTAYDAAYVALAEALDATLLTCDRRLASAPGHGARIALAQP